MSCEYHEAWKMPTSRNERRILVELRIIYAIAGQLGMPTHQKRGLVPIWRNQSRGVEEILLKRVITEVEISNIEVDKYIEWRFLWQSVHPRAKFSSTGQGRYAHQKRGRQNRRIQLWFSQWSSDSAVMESELRAFSVSARDRTLRNWRRATEELCAWHWRLLPSNSVDFTFPCQLIFCFFFFFFFSFQLFVISISSFSLSLINPSTRVGSVYPASSLPSPFLSSFPSSHWFICVSARERLCGNETW